MKKLFYLFNFILFSLLLVSPVFAQQIEINENQEIDIPFSGFYPFSDSANQIIQEGIDSNPNVTVTIINFNGKPFFIAPAADASEVGRKQKIKRNGVHILNFKKGKSKRRLGLSFVPKGKETTAELLIEPFAGRGCPNPISNCAGPEGTSCGENLGKCCEKDANGNQVKICVRTAASKCSCSIMSN